MKLLGLFALLFSIETYAQDCKAVKVFDETLRIVNQNFYDPDFKGIPWNERVEFYRKNLKCEMSSEELAIQTNKLLSELKTSHTGFYPRSDQYFWALNSIFSRKIDGFPFAQIGIWAIHLPAQGWFVQDVFEGSIAEKAGLRTGDKLIKLDDENFHPLQFISNRKQRLLVQAKPGEPATTIEVIPQRQSFQEVMLKATSRSTRIFHRRGKKIGYIHLWAGTHKKLENAFVTQLKSLRGRVDALIIDLRNGFGGAHPGFIEPLYKDKNLSKVPLIALINSGTRSGKEWVAYKLKKDGRAVLLGETTAGAFIGGTLFEISNGDYALYLAVEKFDPEDVLDPIEGVGVNPDILSLGCTSFCGGADPQLEAALLKATEKL